MYLPQQIIRAKRNGETLTQEQVQCFVNGLVDGNFNDAQVGAMAMAIFQQGMNTEETVWLTQAMMHSGTVLSWPGADKPVVDKHSTGGVGDKVSFMLAAIVAACGAYVPMISGRGLGHTGGTSDKLESIAGIDIQPSVANFQRMVKEEGTAIITQTSDLAPADKRLYSIRDITATVESIPLITASILSKKLAAGLDALVMDVKVGNGAMMRNLDDAQALANSIVNVANGAGVKTQAIITDMNQVLGVSAGNALEMVESVDYLTGKLREPRLHRITVELAKAMLINTGVCQTSDEAGINIERALSSGKAAEIFAKMITALGGPSDFIENPWRLMQRAQVVKDIVAPSAGYIASMQTFDIGMAIVGMKGGRTANGQQIDHSVGFDRVLPVGTKVNKGDCIARIHASNTEQAEHFSQAYVNALSFSQDAPSETPVIYGD
ncbi:thymidine phosphorylase [Thalassotalea marina]|uniref:Thymidine phosphorylase n=1 Tax=Thalassotalea marina TaxID=1673741 RepID=A0A919BT00_9GAMM|nr:thymidine phosphorylase [Thalassotalea marina]GHG08443.1 thymidine phosphorylase [Thalassotalea marina]